MHHYYHRLQDPDTVYALVRDIFCAGAITSFLWAFHHISRGVVLRSRVKALVAFGDAYTPEEREVLIHKIKVQSLRR
jgi:hypothetical protein